jgi:hypothetical protein
VDGAKNGPQLRTSWLGFQVLLSRLGIIAGVLGKPTVSERDILAEILVEVRLQSVLGKHLFLRVRNTNF